LTNAGKSPRQRLTLIRLYEELHALGYAGSYDAVRRYAKAWSKEQGAVTAEARAWQSRRQRIKVRPKASKALMAST
jgi:hypothetical protein